MQTKPLLYGLAGFFIGGFLVAAAATTFEKPNDNTMNDSGMTALLKEKTGDEYDKAFITNMIIHHQDAVEMAKLSADNAKHNEIKQLSNDIIAAQQKEINQMQQWQVNWGYQATDDRDQMRH